MLAACLYAVLTLCFTYPHVRHLTTSFAQSHVGESSDQNIVLWDAWWAKKSLLDLKTSPFHTDFLFYPNGTSLALHELTLLNSLFTIPFQLALDKPGGLILGCNVAILLTFVTTGLGMYALVRYLEGDSLVAFFGGVAFAFCPYRTMHIVHTDLLSMGWIALYTLFVLKTLRERSYVNPIVAALFFFVTLLTCTVYTYFLILLTGVILAYYMVFEQRNMKIVEVWRRLAVLCLLILVVLAPKVIAILNSGAVASQPEWTLEMLSANLAGFVWPADKHVLYRFIFGLLPEFTYYLSGVPGHATFLTYTVIGLATVGLFKKPLRATGFWLCLFVLFFVLSLGPYLLVWKWSTSVPLPYLILYKWLPFFSVMRTPYRFIVLAEMGIIVLGCFGLTHVLNRLSNISAYGGTRGAGVVRGCVAGGLILLVLVELWNVRFRESVVSAPPIYTEIAKEPGEFAVLDLPINRYYALTEYMYYQTIHEKPIPTGVLSRYDKSLRDFANELAPRGGSPAELSGTEVERLIEAGVRYVIYHNPDNLDDIRFVFKLY
ncbi:MAG: hypothetical protein Kow0099_28840 [Candidatus Abyssubacteria bacterium]